MKKNTSLPAALLFLPFAFSCNGIQNEKSATYAAADSSTNVFVPSSAASHKSNDASRKFIRTADLRFKVENVVRSTYHIEDIISSHGGFVTYTKLSSDINNVIKTPVSADSTLETTYSNIINNITLRVPDTALNATLKDIATNITYLDHRIIKADDIALQILSNKLSQKRSAASAERLKNAIDNRGKKLRETTLAEDGLQELEKQNDQALLANLSLNDQVNFSTVNISIYQRQVVKHELLSNERNRAAFERSFGFKMLESLDDGLLIIESLILMLTKLWWLLLLAVPAYFVYRFAAVKRK